MQRYAVKGNREVAVTNEAEEKDLVKQGYDIVDRDGKLITPGRGKTVPYEQIASLKEENDNLKADYDALNKQFKALQEENKKLKVQFKEAEKK